MQIACGIAVAGDLLAVAGDDRALPGLEVTATPRVADGMHGAIIRATKPVDGSADEVRPVDLPRPTSLSMAPDAGGGCCGGSGCC